jgi:hypothetical protein
MLQCGRPEVVLTAHQFHGKLDYLGRVDLGFLAWQAGRT